MDGRGATRGRPALRRARARMPWIAWIGLLSAPLARGAEAPPLVANPYFTSETTITPLSLIHI